MRPHLSRILWALLLAGCARSTSAGPSTGGGNILTQAQLSATSSMSVLDALGKLRPDWLQSRGPTSMTDATLAVPSVYMNGTMLGSIDYLRTVPVLDVKEVRYWDAGRASARFGMGHPRGVIEIVRP